MRATAGQKAISLAATDSQRCTCAAPSGSRGSLTAAASALDTSLPTVVRRLAELERHAAIHFTGRSVLSEWQFRVNGRLGAFLSYQVQAAVRAGRLKPVLRQYETDPLPVSILYPHAGLMSARVRAFIDFVVPRLRKQDFTKL